MDRLGWAAGFSFRAYGLTIGVRATDPSWLDEVRRRLPPGAAASPSEVVDRLYSFVVPRPARPGLRGYYLLYADAARVCRALDAAEPLDAFEESLPAFLSEWARGRVFVHAGAVGWRGRAILLPGQTFTGKSVLTAALVRAGASYCSDEFAVLDRHGRLHPYARPLGLRDASLNARPTPVEALGGVAAKRPLPVGGVLFCSYKPGARFRMRRLSPGQALLRLLPHTIAMRERPERSLEALQGAVASARAFSVTRGEADEAARALLEQAF